MTRRRMHLGVEDDLIRLSAGTAAYREAAAQTVKTLGDVADWSVVGDLLGERRLLPLLGPRLVELAGDRAGEAFKCRVEHALIAGRRQGTILQMVSDRVMAGLADAGICSTALKGPMLSEALYGDPGRRPSGDIDLLVARERLHDAVEVVRGLGYRAPTDHVDAEGLPLLHFALAHERNQLPRVELHWRIHWYERSFAGERLMAPSEYCGDTWRPAPIDELIALLLFYARDGFMNLRHATDLGACWDIYGTELPPGAMEEPMRAYPALEHVLLAAVTVAETTVGLPSKRLVEHDVRLGRRGRVAVRLALPYPRASQTQLHADMGLIDGLLSPHGGFKAFLRRQVMPPREVLRGYARATQRRRASSVAGHSMRVLGRYLLAMTRLFRVHEDASSG
jgi:hypothetical protein